MVLVTGATGQLGRAVIDCLLRMAPAERIAVLARDAGRAADLAARGVSVRQGDYTHRRSLENAFAGVKKLLLVSTNALEGVAEQHATAIEAAKAVGVGHVVFTSMYSRSDPPRIPLVHEYRQSEQDLINSGLAYTILRNGYYMEMLPLFIGDAPQTGQLYYPAGEGRTSFTARTDLAEAAANVLMGNDHEGRLYRLCAPEVCTFSEIAEALSETVGRKIDYINPSLDEYEAALRDAGLSPLEIKLMVSIAESIQHEEGWCPNGELEQLLGRTSVRLRQFVTQTFGQADGERFIARS